MKCKTPTCHTEVVLPKRFCAECITKRRKQQRERWFADNPEGYRTHHKRKAAAQVAPTKDWVEKVKALHPPYVKPEIYPDEIPVRLEYASKVC